MRRYIIQIRNWTAIFPALLFWPFLPACPAFLIWEGISSMLVKTFQGLLFVRVFWSLAAIAVGVWLVLSDAARTLVSDARKRMVLVMGWYANLWTALYIIAAIPNR